MLTINASAVVGLEHISGYFGPGSLNGFSVDQEHVKDEHSLWPDRNHTCYSISAYGVFPSSPFDPDYVSADFTAFTVLGGTPDPSTTRLYQIGGSCLDEGMSLYFAQPGQAFRDQNILGGGFVEVPFNLLALPPDFYFAIRTPGDIVDQNLLPEGYLDPAFGWAHMVLNPALGYHEIVDHAMAYDVQGIVIGTTIEIVPEPGTSTLGFLALAVICLNRRRTSKAF